MKPYEIKQRLQKRFNDVVKNHQVGESKRYIIVRPQQPALKKKDNEVDKRARSLQRTLIKKAMEDFRRTMVDRGVSKEKVNEHLQRQGLEKSKPELEPSQI